MEMDRLIRRNIKRFREQRGWSQEELAARVGVSQNLVSKWEQGDNDYARTPRSANLHRVAQALGRPTDHFYLENPPPAPPMKDQQAFAVRFKIAGKPPAGLQKDLDAAVAKVLAEYTPERGIAQHKLKQEMKKKR